MYRSFLKRALDITGALILLPLVLIVTIVVAPLIYFTDRGPVFYNAERMGKGGRRFKMYKFRSMRVNAPDIRNADGSTYNGEHDPRVTKIGRLLRKTSIDELPQLLNVLLGDMSFVGPRPHLTGMRLEDMDDVQRKRLEVRPGITGYSQAYFRNSIPAAERDTNDACYVDRLSFGFDMKILWRTVLSVLRREHIYVESPLKQ